MRPGWAVTTDCFSLDTNSRRAAGRRPFLLCMGLFSRFCVWAPRYIAHRASNTPVEALCPGDRWCC
jgi:hypothetical protein